jgi:hypothetical protein
MGSTFILASLSSTVAGGAWGSTGGFWLGGVLGAGGSSAFRTFSAFSFADFLGNLNHLLRFFPPAFLMQVSFFPPFALHLEYTPILNAIKRIEVKPY